MNAEEWRILDRDARYVARIQAAALGFSNDTTLSHESAAALWGLPIIGPWPSDIHLLVERAGGGRSDPGVRRHALGLEDRDTTRVDDIRVTTLARTVIDLAAASPLYSAVAAADAAIHAPRYGPDPRLTKADLFDEWERMMPFRGFARARRVIEFAESASGSTSETASRVTTALLGFPPPELQREFHVNGALVMVDFYFPEVDGIGECDGFEKYTNPAVRGSRSAEQVVVDEKLREDALRRQVSGFARWDSREAMTPGLLRVKLLELGLRQSRPRIRGR